MYTYGDSDADVLTRRRDNIEPFHGAFQQRQCNGLKGQQQTAQGNALGSHESSDKRPERAKALNLMPQSLSKIYLHVIFHVKTTSPKIDESHWPRVHEYIGQLINTTGCKSLCVGGVTDHIHALCVLSRQVTVSHLVEEMKRNSSRWMKTLDKRYETFQWQGGYAVFSVGQSLVDKSREYILHQREHHTKMTFREEYVRFLELYHIEYDKVYVLSD
jgi:REP element-mobilizing transposase RayT